MCNLPKNGYSALRKGRVSIPGHCYLITTVTYRRRPWFLEFQLGCTLAREIQRLEHGNELNSLAWVIMPDHLHFLLTLEDTPLSTVINRLKGRSARYINQILAQQGPIWQSGYHDHALRKDEDLKAAARYIIANPLRAGLVGSVKNYPFWNAAWL